MVRVFAIVLAIAMTFACARRNDIDGELDTGRLYKFMLPLYILIETNHCNMYNNIACAEVIIIYKCSAKLHKI